MTKLVVALMMLLNFKITIPEDRLNLNFSDYWLQKCRFQARYEETIGGTLVHIKMNCNNR